MKECDACGKQISGKATKCPHCGNKSAGPIFYIIMIFAIAAAIDIMFFKGTVAASESRNLVLTQA